MPYQWSELTKLILLAVVYTLLAKVSLSFFSLYNGNISIAWPPSGLALAALLLGGKKYWPGVFIGALIGNLMAGNSMGLSTTIAIGNTIESLTGFFLLANSPFFNLNFFRPQDYLQLIVSSLLCSGLAAIIGIYGLWLHNNLPQSTLVAALVNWWQGDALGIITFTPFILVWRVPPSSWLTRNRILEITIGFALMIFIGNVVFLDWFKTTFSLLARGYWMFLFVAWAAIRFGRHGTTLMSTTTAVLAFQGIANGKGFFAQDFEQTHLLNFWIYITTLTIVGLSLALAIRERQNALDETEAAKQQIAKAEEHSRLILEAAGEGIYGLDLEGKTTFANTACCHMLGYRLEELLGQPMHALIHHSYSDGSHYPREKCPMYAAFNDGKTYRVTDEVLWRKDGTSIPMEYTSTPIFNNGTLAGAVVIFNDISQRKLAEDKLRESEAFQLSILNSVSEEIAVIGQDGVIKMVNEAWRHFAVRDREASQNTLSDGYIGTNYLEICKISSAQGVEQSKEALQGIRDVLQGQTALFSLEYPCAIADRTQWFKMKVTPLLSGCIRGAVISHSNISEHKELQSVLQESEARFRSLANSAPVLIWVAETDKGCSWFNDTWLNYTGRSLEQELGNGWAEGVHADDLARCLDIYVSHFDVRKPFYMEYRLRGKDGEYHWFIDVGKPRFNERAQFVGYIGMLTDIQERKRLEESIHFRQFSLDHVGEEVFWIDCNGRIIDANDTACTKLGYSRTEICLLTVADVDPVFPFEKWPEHWQELTQQGSLRFESIHQTRNGERFPTEVVANYFEYQNKAYNCALVRDISERKQFETALKDQTDYLNTIFNSEPECVKVVAGDGTLLDMNPAGLKLLEVESIEEARQFGLVNFILPEFRTQFKNLQHEVFEGKSGVLEFMIEGKRGTRHWLDTHAAPLIDKNGKVKALVGVTRDITERIHLLQELERQAKYDFLTGLANRRHFLELAELEVTRTQRYGKSLSLMMIDIDFFKRINDSYGHKAGDLVLQHFATISKQVLREVDVIGRIGGEEFAVLLPETPGLEASEVAERIRLAIAHTSIELNSSEKPLIITVSIGVSEMGMDQDTVDTVLQRADDALYLAKNSGRNKVISG